MRQMNKPEGITLSELYTGSPVTLGWEPVAEAGGYNIYRGINGARPALWGTCLLPQWLDTLPLDAQTVEYGVTAWSGFAHSWDEIDEKTQKYNWNAMDGLNWQWGGEESAPCLTGEREVTPNRAPVLTLEEEDLGTRYRGFSLAFRVTDPDPWDRIAVTALLDGVTLQVWREVLPDTRYLVEIADSRVEAMEDGSRHSLTLIAEDGKGGHAQQTAWFTAVEDFWRDAVFYVLRDGIPVAQVKNASQWTDYLETGTHSYCIRAVDRYDNYSDSNQVEVAILVEHATLAPVERPDEFVALTLRRGHKPQTAQRVEAKMEAVAFLGRDKPVFYNSGPACKTQRLAFTTTTRQAHRRLDDMMAGGSLLVYRDVYGNRLVGIARERPSEFIGTGLGAYEQVVDFELVLEEADWDERAAYD